MSQGPAVHRKHKTYERRHNGTNTGTSADAVVDTILTSLFFSSLSHCIQNNLPNPTSCADPMARKNTETRKSRKFHSNSSCNHFCEQEGQNAAEIMVDKCHVPREAAGKE